MEFCAVVLFLQTVTFGHWQETLWSGGCEDDDGQSESEAFAQDYLKRVRKV